MYGVADRALHYKDKVAQNVMKWPTCLQVTMEWKTLDQVDSFYIMRFSQTIELPWIDNGAQNYRARDLICYVVEMSAVAVLSMGPVLI